MPQVKVWNDNDYIYEEKFKGEHYVIEPHQFIEMEADEALMFLGTYKAIKKTGQGTDDPRSFKKLRMDQPPVAPVDPLMCHANGKLASSPEELAKLAAAFAHLRAVDQDAENAAKAKLEAENAVLKGDVEVLKAQVSALMAQQSADVKKKG